jgi:hypothetical protein
MQELYSGSVRVAPLRKAQPAKIRFQRAVMLVRHDRLIGEVKRACNLTIKIGQEARADPTGTLGSLSAMAVFRAKSGLQLIWDVTEFADRVNFSVWGVIHQSGF